MALPRRQIEEIIALHDLERELVDIYVEGPLDEDVIRWALGPEHRNAQVYCVDTVHLESVHEGGNRGRLIALATALKDRVASFKVTCLCDRDFERWCPTIHPTIDSFIVLTDFANLEAYYFTEEVIAKFLQLAVRYPDPPRQLLNCLSKPLRDAFLLRLAHAVLGWPLHWIPIERSCTFAKPCEISFDRDQHIIKLLQKNSKSRHLDEFKKKIQELESQLETDPRFWTHGHDFSELLCSFLRKLDYGCYTNSDQVLRTLLASAERAAFQSFPMVQELIRRAHIHANSNEKSHPTPDTRQGSVDDCAQRHE